MLKKAKAEFESEAKAGGRPTPTLSKAILESSHQIWLAGLGAFAKAQEGGAKVFETLVKQGEVLEARTRKTAAQTADVARDAARSKAREMQAIAGGTWDKLEQVFEARVQRALSKLGVYSAADVQRLTERVDRLSAAVDDLLKAQEKERKAPAAAGRGARKGRARRPAAKPAAK
ncbi:MAG TPA: phasin family protein [Casimicrobiaceae bacterium]|nr:phasin family protein [Casimicrobiaceae bacterium]